MAWLSTIGVSGYLQAGVLWRDVVPWTRAILFMAQVASG